MATAPSLTAAEHTWAAMGTRCRALLVGVDPDAALGTIPAIVDRLEAAWSRFRPTSDVQRLNEAGGAPVVVAPETLDLLGLALTWWHATEGRFDPSVLPALEAAGYVRSHDLGPGPIRAGSPAPGLGELRLDTLAGTAMLPAHVRLDLGGIGKGRAADLVAEHLAAVPGGLVDLGGDVRVWGPAPDGAPGWAIGVEDLRDGRTLAVLGLTAGAVATSSTLRRRWSDGDRDAHHLIDPSTGRPADGDLVTVTVVADAAAPAEVLAKAALVAGSAAAAVDLLGRFDVAALLVPAQGPPTAVGGFEALCWTPPEELT